MSLRTPSLPLRRALAGLGIALWLCGLGWLLLLPPVSEPLPAPVQLEALTPGSVAAMTSPPFAYSHGWRVTDLGADPPEPADPWLTPSGVVTFSVVGQELALNLAQGDYWGYLYVTVDGAPANRLARIPGNANSAGQTAGYITLYAPEAQSDTGPTPRWVVVHRAATPQTAQQVRVEIWRSWGQTPLRAVAVDALPAAGRPAWVGWLALVVASAMLALSRPRFPAPQQLSAWLEWATRPVAAQRRGDAVAAAGGLLVAAAMLGQVWWLGPPGLALLGYAALASPLRWAAAFLVGLPFYFAMPVPILPGRATNLVDIGVLGGLAVSLGYWLRTARPIPVRAGLLWVAALAGWALVASSAAQHGDVAWREWRTVFVAALGFGVLLSACASEPTTRTPQRTTVVVGAWLAGALLMATVGIGQVLTGANLIEAEGVMRVRGLYGSPNNLALYLERVLFLPLAGAMLLPNGVRRVALLAATGLLAAALLLTFSKGALLLGLPAGLATLWLGGLIILRRQGRPARVLWWLAAVAAAIGLALLPFVGAERFRRLLDFETGTGMTRLLLWRSAWQMALDHPWLGVGPDNFLYHYRSGYLLPAAWQEPNLNHPHNLLLDWWTRLGLPGLALGMGWMAMGVWGVAKSTLAARLATTAGAGDAALWLGVLAGSVAALAHGLIDLSYAVPDLMLVWVLLFSLPDLAGKETSPTRAR